MSGTYLINYLATRGPELQPFVAASLIQLLCRVTKFGWFDDDRFRDLVKESMNFLSQVIKSDCLICMQCGILHPRMICRTRIKQRLKCVCWHYVTAISYVCCSREKNYSSPTYFGNIINVFITILDIAGKCGLCGHNYGHSKSKNLDAMAKIASGTIF